MKVVFCLDDENGMLSNKRRQSKDREVIKNFVALAGENKILINEFSRKLFEEQGFYPEVREDFLLNAGSQDFCFVENCGIGQNISNVDEIIIYKWNRKYPKDFVMDINLSEAGFNLYETVEFKGFSHEKITREAYKR